jgi:putative sigma-54 modulation protein
MNRKTKAAEFVNEGYDITITGRHVLVTESMKDYALEKLSKIERFADRIIDMQVTMDIQKLQHRVDIVTQVNHIRIKSSATSEDMYISIDRAVEKLQRQLLDYKGKLQEHLGKPSLSTVDIRVNVIRPIQEEGAIWEINDEIEDENQRSILEQYKPHRIVSQEKHPLRTLSYQEAIMKMDLSGDVFLLFRSEEDQQLKLIYRRSDDNYAIIEPENQSPTA